MFFSPANPYQGIVDALEEAVAACHRAMGEIQQVPFEKGRRDTQDPTWQAKNLLEEAIQAATSWRDAFAYHVEGGHGGHRSDF